MPAMSSGAEHKLEKATDEQSSTYKMYLHNNIDLLDLKQSQINSVSDIDHAYFSLVNAVTTSAKQCFPLK